jgi:hypothetical protein
MDRLGASRLCCWLCLVVALAVDPSCCCRIIVIAIAVAVAVNLAYSAPLEEASSACP